MMRTLVLVLLVIATVVMSQIGRAEAPLVNTTCPQGSHSVQDTNGNWHCIWDN